MFKSPMCIDQYRQKGWQPFLNVKMKGTLFFIKIIISHKIKHIGNNTNTLYFTFSLLIEN